MTHNSKTVKLRSGLLNKPDLLCTVYELKVGDIYNFYKALDKNDDAKMETYDGYFAENSVDMLNRAKSVVKFNNGFDLSKITLREKVIIREAFNKLNSSFIATETVEQQQARLKLLKEIGQIQEIVTVEHTLKMFEINIFNLIDLGHINVLEYDYSFYANLIKHKSKKDG